MATANTHDYGMGRNTCTLPMPPEQVEPVFNSPRVFVEPPLRILHDEMRLFTRKQHEALLHASRCEYCGLKHLGSDQRCSGCGNVL
jgi:hypothetical protein